MWTRRLSSNAVAIGTAFLITLAFSFCTYGTPIPDVGADRVSSSSVAPSDSIVDQGYTNDPDSWGYIEVDPIEWEP